MVFKRVCTAYDGEERISAQLADEMIKDFSTVIKNSQGHWDLQADISKAYRLLTAWSEEAKVASPEKNARRSESSLENIEEEPRAVETQHNSIAAGSPIQPERREAVQNDSQVRGAPVGRSYQRGKTSY